MAATVRKAYRDNYQFQFSYVHSSARGNYVGSVAPDGQVDPGITSGDYLSGFWQGTREALFEKDR